MSAETKLTSNLNQQINLDPKTQNNSELDALISEMDSESAELESAFKAIEEESSKTNKNTLNTANGAQSQPIERENPDENAQEPIQPQPNYKEQKGISYDLPETLEELRNQYNIPEDATTLEFRSEDKVLFRTISNNQQSYEHFKKTAGGKRFELFAHTEISGNRIESKFGVKIADDPFDLESVFDKLPPLQAFLDQHNIPNNSKEVFFELGNPLRKSFKNDPQSFQDFENFVRGSSYLITGYRAENGQEVVFEKPIEINPEAVKQTPPTQPTQEFTAVSLDQTPLGKVAEPEDQTPLGKVAEPEKQTPEQTGPFKGWTRVSAKQGGANSAGKNGGVYKDAKNRHALIKRDPNVGKLIAEFAATKMMYDRESALESESGPDFRHRAPEVALVKDKYGTPYMISYFHDNYQDLSKALGYKFRPRAIKEFGIILSPFIQTKFMRFNDDILKTHEGRKAFAEAVASRIEDGDFDIHIDNLGISKKDKSEPDKDPKKDPKDKDKNGPDKDPKNKDKNEPNKDPKNKDKSEPNKDPKNKDKSEPNKDPKNKDKSEPNKDPKNLVSIDFGAALNFAYGYGKEVHPHSDSRHPVGKGPTNHFKDFKREIRTSQEMADHIFLITSYRARKIKKESFKQAMDQAFDTFSVADMIAFKEHMTGEKQNLTPGQIREINKDILKEEIIASFNEIYEARSKDFRKFACEIALGRALERTFDKEGKPDFSKLATDKIFKTAVRENLQYFADIAAGEDVKDRTKIISKLTKKQKEEFREAVGSVVNQLGESYKKPAELSETATQSIEASTSNQVVEPTTTPETQPATTWKPAVKPEPISLEKKQEVLESLSTFLADAVTDLNAKINSTVKLDTIVELSEARPESLKSLEEKINILEGNLEAKIKELNDIPAAEQNNNELKEEIIKLQQTISKLKKRHKNTSEGTEVLNAKINSEEYKKIISTEYISQMESLRDQIEARISQLQKLKPEEINISESKLKTLELISLTDEPIRSFDGAIKQAFDPLFSLNDSLKKADGKYKIEEPETRNRIAKKLEDSFKEKDLSSWIEDIEALNAKLESLHKNPLLSKEQIQNLKAKCDKIAENYKKIEENLDNPAEIESVVTETISLKKSFDLAFKQAREKYMNLATIGAHILQSDKKLLESSSKFAAVNPDNQQKMKSEATQKTVMNLENITKILTGLLGKVEVVEKEEVKEEAKKEKTQEKKEVKFSIEEPEVEPTKQIPLATSPKQIVLPNSSSISEAASSTRAPTPKEAEIALDEIIEGLEATTTPQVSVSSRVAEPQSAYSSLTDEEISELNGKLKNRNFADLVSADIVPSNCQAVKLTYKNKNNEIADAWYPIADPNAMVVLPSTLNLSSTAVVTSYKDKDGQEFQVDLDKIRALTPKDVSDSQKQSSQEHKKPESTLTYLQGKIASLWQKLKNSSPFTKAASRAQDENNETMERKNTAQSEREQYNFSNIHKAFAPPPIPSSYVTQPAAATQWVSAQPTTTATPAEPAAATTEPSTKIPESSAQLAQKESIFSPSKIDAKLWHKELKSVTTQELEAQSNELDKKLKAKFGKDFTPNWEEVVKKEGRPKKLDPESIAKEQDKSKDKGI